jgi:pyruvate/2-oxoglutarate/acetoin dehydrogenase E1 component
MSAELTYVEAVRRTLHDALAEDDRVVLLGEDIGAGGAFRATEGLRDEFGPERVRDTPISEDAFTGVAVGLALEGYRPVVEYQFADFLTSGMTQIVNVAAKMHFRTGASVPLVIRAPSGGGFSGGPFHSQSPEAWFLHTPGLKVCAPSTVEDVGLLLGAAIRDPNPVLVFEPKILYTRAKGALASSPAARLEGAAVRRKGTDVTVVTYGGAAHLALAAAERLAGEGVDAEVVDLRVLCPLDWDTVAASVRKTNRCIVVHEDYAEYGVGAEVAARVASELFEELDAPLARVGAAFHPIPFSPPLEAATLPSAERIADAVREVAAF